MASPLEPSQISFLVPLLLVIVERLATLTRSIADEPTDFTDTRPLLAPVSEPTDTGASSEGFHLVPRLGRLNILHLTNVSLLTAAVVLLAGTEPGLITNVLALLVAVIWLQLPLIEVDLS